MRSAGQFCFDSPATKLLLSIGRNMFNLRHLSSSKEDLYVSIPCHGAFAQINSIFSWDIAYKEKSLNTYGHYLPLIIKSHIAKRFALVYRYTIKPTNWLIANALRLRRPQIGFRIILYSKSSPTVSFHRRRKGVDIYPRCLTYLLG